MNPDKEVYPVFDGKDFGDWKFRVELILAERELLRHVETEPKADDLLKDDWLKTDVKAKNVIVKSLSQKHLHIVRAEKSAYSMLKALIEVFQKTGAMQERHLRMKLCKLKCAEGQELSSHFATFDAIVTDLRAAGAAMTETEQVTNLLLSLPRSYDNVVTVLESFDDLTLRKVKARLLNEEIKRFETSGATSIPTRQEEDSSSGSSKAVFLGARKKFSGKCWKCKQQGHKSYECNSDGVEVKDEQGDETRTKPSNLQKKVFNLSRREDDRDQEEFVRGAFAFTTSGRGDRGGSQSDSDCITWIVDSGCTDHMVNDDSVFHVERCLLSPYPVSLAEEGQAIVATKIGFIASSSSIDGHEYECHMSDVLYAPGLRHNLLSVSRLEKAGFTAVFRSGCVELWADDLLFAVGRRRNDLYELKFEVKQSYAGIAAVVKTNGLWHRRFGHTGMECIRQMARKGIVIGMDTSITDTLGVCEPCVMGKHSRTPFQQREQRASRPLELVHTDVCGPITPATYDGKRYFVSFIDDYTHFTIIFLINSRDEVFECLKEYHSAVIAWFNSPLSRMRCDNGGEYSSQMIKEYCKAKGVALEYTVAYTPQQNGTAERMNRTLVEKARSMLYESKLPKEMWGESIMAATYLTNRSCTKVLNDATPAELWCGKKPNVSNLRVFGCRAYALMPKCKRGKMDRKSKKYIMIGYSGNGYRLWDFENKKVVLSRDVVFDEEVCPGLEVPSSHGDREIVREEPLLVGEQVVADPEAGPDAEPDVGPDAEHDTEISDGELYLTGEGDSLFRGFSDGEQSDSVDDEGSPEEAEVEQRRSGRNRRTPAWHNDYVVESTALLMESIEDVPLSYEDIKNRSDETEWYQAVCDELKSLEENHTWNVVDPPKGAKIISSKWVFKKKVDKNGNLDRFKARLVARGFLQTAGVDYHETYAPVAKLSTVRFLLAVGVQFDFEFCHMDVTTAFLYGYLEETIYMKPPAGLAVALGKVCELKRSLYGLKQSPKCWNNRLHDFLVGLHFSRSTTDYCLYIRISESSQLYILLYVDDLLICGSDRNEIDEVKRTLSGEFRMKDLGQVEHFMGMRIGIDRAAGKITIDQTAFAERILEKFGMQSCNSVSTPVESGIKLVQRKIKGSSEEQSSFRQLIGSLMYLMLGSRPDLSFAINLFSRYQDNAAQEHMMCLKRVLRYLKGTTEMRLTYTRKPDAAPLEGYVDSDWANDINDRKSTSGFLYEVFGNLVSWTTKKQAVVTLSTAEAEYVAASLAVCEAVWYKKLFQDIGYPLRDAITINEDNQACIFISKNPESKRTKHIDIKYHYVREKVWDKTVELKHVSSENQKADILTKPLAKVSFEKLRQDLCLERGGV